MEPEEYQRNLREGLSGASSLVSHVCWLTVAVIVCAVVLFAAWRFRQAITDLLNVGLAPGLDHFRLLVKQKTVRRPLAIAGAGGTLMVGMTAGVLQLDGGWLTRNHRFWHRTPAQVEEWLLHWAILMPASASLDEDIFAWGARQNPSLFQGMSTSEIASLLLEEMRKRS